LSDGVDVEGCSHFEMWKTETVHHSRETSDVTGTSDDVTILIFPTVHGQHSLRTPMLSLTHTPLTLCV